MNNETLKNLTKLKISGMLSEAARREVECKLLEKPATEILKPTATTNFS